MPARNGRGGRGEGVALALLLSLTAAQFPLGWLANVTTLAGNTTAGRANGQGAAAGFCPYGVTVSSDGTVFVATS